MSASDRQSRSAWQYAAGNLFLLGAALAFGVGIRAPMLTLTKWILVHNTYSVLSGIWEFYLEHNYPLFALLALFTLVLPTVKLALLFYSWNRPRAANRRLLRWIDVLGKWSMLDVFVVAILITSVKLGSLATTELHYGLYVFAASVVMMMLASHVVYREVRRAVQDTSG
ncbi:MAG: paraquat-inducible protein A [Arenicellales bacterium]